MLAVVGASARAWADPVTAPASGSTDAPAPAEYRALANEGFEEFERRNYPEALALFERANAVQASPRMERAIAKCLFELRRYAEAVLACDRALAATQDALGEGLRDDVRELRARALGFTGLVRVVAEPPSATVLVDGRPLALVAGRTEQRLDVGRHVVEASAQGRTPIRREMAVDVGRTVEARLDLPPVLVVDSAPPSRAAAYALLGAGAALATGALVTSSLWFTDRSNAVDTCNEAAAHGARCGNGSSVATQRDLSLGAVVVSATVLAGTIAVFTLVALHRSPSTSSAAAFASGARGLAW